jgi:hypothetical protein
MGLDYAQKNWDSEGIKLTVDKFVVVLVGAPRGVSTLTWVRNMPDQLRKTLYDEVNVATKTHRKQSLLDWGAHPDYKPEFHVCCVTSSFDSVDRYLTGEDYTLAGLDHTPYMTNTTTRKQVDKLEELTYFKDNLPDGRYLKYGKIPLKKEKWEAYHRKHWAWADSVNFSYQDPYVTANSWLTHIKTKATHCQWTPHGPLWGNQYLHFVQAYNDNRELFDSLTRNSVVLRVRWDMHFGPTVTLWDFALLALSRAYNDMSKPETPVNWHHSNFDLSPVAVVGYSKYLKGHSSANDYWHCFDGPGGQLLGSNFNNWMLENPDRRMPGLHVYHPSQPPNNISNHWKIPEGVIMEFLIEHQYTIYEHRGTLDIPVELATFRTLMADQYRWEWYEWTDAMMKELKDAA